MVIYWDNYINEYSQNHIYQMLMTSPEESINEDVYQLLMTAQSQKHHLIVAFGIHTDFMMIKNSNDYKQPFVPFWFDVETDEKTKYNEKKRYHVYVGKFKMIQDMYGNVYWERLNVKSSPKDGYTPVKEHGEDNMIIKWFFTGTITSDSKSNDMIAMNGGGKKIIKSKKELIPVSISIPFINKDSKKLEKKNISLIKKFKNSLKRIFKK